MTDTRDKRIHSIIYSNDSREELGERIVALEDENAKLRKFSKSAWRVMTHNESPWAWKVMVATARELGIEVS